MGGVNHADGLGDFVPYAIDGVKNADGSTYAGIPLFGCTNVLFCRDGLGLERANTFDEVRNIVQTCRFTGLVPGKPPHNGMMLDIAGKTTNATYYLATQYAMTGAYPFPTPTSSGSTLPAQTSASAKKLAALLGSKEVMVAASTGVDQPDGVPQYPDVHPVR